MNLLRAKLHGDHKVGAEIGLRPKTRLKRWKIYFCFNRGGMGDFVNYAAATQWLMRTSPWVIGRIASPRYLVPLMQDIHPSWQCIASEDIKRHLETGDALIGSDLEINGMPGHKQFLTVVGAHPVDVGFAHYAGTTPPPPDGWLPILDYPKHRLVKNIGPYAVLPVGNVQESRKVLGRHLNPLVRHIRLLGIMPVFLGKRDPQGNGANGTTWSDDIEYELGLDLRDQTTVKEAAAIMQHAEFTAGLDTGLLHLAALMKDSRILFGYNITSVAHREPRREHGRHVNVTVGQSELDCIGCQSKLKLITGHTFDKCLYGDNKCVDLLFANDAEKWTRAIGVVMRD